MARFMRARGFSDYDELWRWSVEDLDGFWGALWEWFEIGATYGFRRFDKHCPVDYEREVDRHRMETVIDQTLCNIQRVDSFS